jgi:hypothetical protein
LHREEFVPEAILCGCLGLLFEIAEAMSVAVELTAVASEPENRTRRNI